MAPGDQSRAGRIGIGPLAQGGGLLRAFDHRLKQDAGGDGGRRIQGGGDLSRVGRDFLQGLGTIKVLAAGGKPALKLFKVNHTGQWNS